MSDAYWRYGAGNNQPSVSLPGQMAVKRPRSEFEMPRGQDTTSYYIPGNERAGIAVTRDTDSVNASYERYLRSLQVPSYGGQTGRPIIGGIDSVHEIDDLRLLGLVASGQAAAAQSRLMGVSGRPEISLPPDASCTLFIEGLPANCTRREVAHIFRPFVGYKEVRLVNKARQTGGDPVVLCFVDFESPAHAATAMDALQGYIFDEHDRDSAHLRVQFARNPPGPRIGSAHRGNR